MLRRGYTLIEVLIVVTVLGIAATMVVPTFSQTSPLRVQAAVRTIVADITQVQSDAVALQVGQGIRFVNDGANTHCILAPVSGTSLDEGTDVTTRRQIGGEEFGNVTFTDMTFPDGVLVFDALGGPVESPGSDVPAATQSVTLTAGNLGYRITIEAYTGRVTVTEIAPREESGGELTGGGTIPTGGG